jgi:propionate CoA-transferase
MTFAEPYNPAYTAPASKRPVMAPPKVVEGAVSPPPVPLDARTIVQRRAYLELLRVQQELAAHEPPRCPVVNLGVGMPAGVAAVAAAESARQGGGGAADDAGYTLTVEAGPIGGTPADLLSFGASAYPEAIIDQAAMFDFYDGGGLDICFLGLAEFDPLGNVNVSRFGHGVHQRIAGLGGFVNISQNAKRVVFMGTLRAGGLIAHGRDGRLVIELEGARAKLLPEVGHLSFNGPYVASLGRPVRYITERAVFDLADGRLTLVEIAPGLDLERDVLAQCGAPVAVSPALRLMDAAVFTPGPMRGRSPG